MKKSYRHCLRMDSRYLRLNMGSPLEDSCLNHTLQTWRISRSNLYGDNHRPLHQHFLPSTRIKAKAFKHIRHQDFKMKLWNSNKLVVISNVLKDEKLIHSVEICLQFIVDSICVICMIHICIAILKILSKNWYRPLWT